MKVVGKNVIKIDAFKLARGEPVFTDDFTRQGMLYAKVLRSPHPHARILNVDAAAALKLDGVVDVIWHRDVKAIPHTRAGQSYPEPSPYDTLILSPKARFIGDRVAVVVAESVAQAIAALDHIVVDYEELPALTDMDQSLTNSEILIHEEPDPRGISEAGMTNIAARIDKQVGDVEAALKECDLVVTRDYHLPRVQASHIEPHISIAWVDEDDRLIVRTSTQVPFHLRRMLARILEIPEARIRVIKPRVGGGFGDKQELVVEDLVGVLALRTGRPVRLEFTREEEFVAARYRHPQRVTMTTGVMKDGTIVANRMYVLADTGAYGSHALTVQGNTGQKVLPMYPVANIHFKMDCVYTNNPISGAFRGYGAPQGCFALECHMDEVARELGMDRLELRKKNHIKLGDTDPLSAKLGEGKEGLVRVVKSTGLEKAIELGCEAIGWGNKREPSAAHLKRGLGMALAMQGSGIAGVDWGGATVKLNDDGSVNLSVGATDIGQGSDTVLAQMCAEELGIPYEKVIILSSDTDLTPFDVGAYASSTTYISGGAVVKAAAEVRGQLAGVLGSHWECEPEDIVFSDGMVTGPGDQSMTIAEVALFALYKAMIQPMATASHMSNDSPPPFAAQFAEVEVDTETGQVHLCRFVSAVDCGTVIHPKMVEGQIEGAVAQGMGYALFEEVLLDRTGRVLTPDFLDYKIASSLDVPEMVTILVPTDEPTGPYGAKAAGEVPIDGPAPAIVNAICDAVGVRMFRIPATAERVWRGLKEETR
ncbi:MAG: molybdopterin-dependent oxidoreductase [Candidatus Krumholzibacteria bacterium]|nr:molybdopterin-dependent oxidoreductase [Candidatus Krumholzibacteria bacterium]